MIDNLTIGEVKQLSALFGGAATKREQEPCDLIGRYVIVRSYAAGVHAGVLVDRVGDRVVLRDSRRLWRWWSRFSLSELADEGVRSDKAGECRFSAPTDSAWELRDWCEIRPCSPAAEASIRGVPNANA